MRRDDILTRPAFVFAIASVLVLLPVIVLASGGANQDKQARWASAFDKIPAEAASRKNPYEGNQEAVLAGEKLFKRHCADCHGTDANGTRGVPCLRSSLLRDATSGTLFWFLRNGDLKRGMPSWSGLPEQQRWQIVCYLKSINPAKDAGTSGRPVVSN